MKIAIISSSGGSAFNAFYNISKNFWPENQYLIITDRPCGIEQVAADFHLPQIRFEEKDNNIFSQKTNDWLIKQGNVDCCFLFFSRLITFPLFSSFPCINFHESLLPSFKGFKALFQAISSGVKFFGATAHLVDADIDHGPIIAQACSPIISSANIDNINQASFIHKVCLELIITEALMEKYLIFSENKIIWLKTPTSGIQFNPDLKNKELKKIIHQLIIKNNVSEFFSSEIL
ncbi:MAG: formyltransferase family protein [Candidatus Pacebacteria bacterium]|nr:formyltransferase family protein [Candidatus Paceibacterota bacterium]